MRKGVVTALSLPVAMLFATFHACKKEKIIVQGSRTDTILIQYEHCQYDTTLPINCYVTHLRSYSRTLRNNKADTLELNVLQYVTLGHCKFSEFIPLYILHTKVIFPGRIPDTAMCRAAGLPLCCPGYTTERPCLQATVKGEPLASSQWNDISSAWFELINICSKTDTLRFSFNLIGQTQYLSHPDSNPQLSCYQHIQPLLQNSCQSFSFKNCTIHLIDIPMRYEPDTITVVYLPQGENNYLIPCCAPAFKDGSGSVPRYKTFYTSTRKGYDRGTIFDETVKIELRCD